MKSIFIKGIACLLIFAMAQSAHSTEAEPQIKGSLAVASDYLWRGITLSAGSSVVQGLIDYLPSQNFYLSLFGTNYVAPGGSEIDFIAGTNHNVNNSLALDFSISHLIFLKDTKQSSLDVSLRFIWEETTTLLASYIPDYFGTESNSLYYSVSHELRLASDKFLGAQVGYNAFSDQNKSGATDYGNANIYLKLVKGEYAMELLYSDTNRKLVASPTGPDATDQVVVAKLKVGF